MGYKISDHDGRGIYDWKTLGSLGERIQDLFSVRYRILEYGGRRICDQSTAGSVGKGIQDSSSGEYSMLKYGGRTICDQRTLGSVGEGIKNSFSVGYRIKSSIVVAEKDIGPSDMMIQSLTRYRVYVFSIQDFMEYRNTPCAEHLDIRLESIYATGNKGYTTVGLGTL